jgi:tRNA (guanine-N7-)-methyltransferase
MKPPIRSYGRVKSRKLSDHKNFLLKNLLLPYEINTESIASIKNFTQICFETGFGFGDFLFEKAKNNPHILFFGCEPHVNGVVNLLAKLEKEPLNNIKISRIDVRELLINFPPQTFDEFYILFPDPWPKSRHLKRRLINLDLLNNLLADKIKSGGKLIIATDHDDYKTWILSTLSQSKKFIWNAASKQDWKVFPADWTITKYQLKAAAEGRESIILNLITT